MRMIVVILLVISTATLAKPLATKTDAKALTEKMMVLFLDKKFKEAVAIAKPNWPMPEVELDGLANQIQTQWPIIEQRFGNAIGTELVREEVVGDSLVRYFYLHKFKNHAIYWQFTFYKPQDQWHVNSISYLDNLDILFTPVKHK